MFSAGIQLLVERGSLTEEASDFKFEWLVGGTGLEPVTSCL